MEKINPKEKIIIFLDNSIELLEIILACFEIGAIAVPISPSITKLERERFGTIALPYYVILSPDDKELATFPGMDTNEQNFINFLNEGYNKFLQTK